MYNKISTLFIALITLGSISTGCGTKDAESEAPLPVVKVDTGLPDHSPNIIYPERWSEVLINANFAKTVVSPVAHFTTSRNACGKEAYGPIDQESWNGFSKNMNLAVQKITAQPALEDYCMAPPEPNAEGMMPKYVDESLHVKVDEKMITLFDQKDGQICTRIPDRELAKTLLDFSNKIILAADKEDCAHGWGSN